MSLKRGSDGEGEGVLGASDILVLATVVALPWFWGGVGLDAYRTAAAVIGIAAGWALARRGMSGLGLNRGVAWLLPAFLLGAWAFAQTMPMPRAWVSRLSPKAATWQAEMFGPAGRDGIAWLRQIEADARALVPEAKEVVAGSDGVLVLGADAPSPPGRFTLSLQPVATRELAFWYVALLLAFLLVHRRTADQGRASIYRATLFVSFGVLAVVGILNRVTAPTRVLWLRDVPPEMNTFGPYWNPSHFGGAMELLAPWLLGYGLAATVHPGGLERKRPGGVFALLGAGVCAAAAVLAASKMAVATIGATSAVLIAFALAGGRGRNRLVLTVTTSAAALLLCVLALAGPLRGRVADFAATHSGGMSVSLRGVVWTAGLRMADDFRLVGTGFGVDGDVLPAYLPRGESGDWGELHNDYLELYVAGGAIAALLAAWLTVNYASRVWRVARSDAAAGRLLPTLGLILGLVSLALHEFVDFNLQIPANALLFVVMAAICVSPLARSAEGS